MNTIKVSNGFAKRAGLLTVAAALSAMSLTAAADRYLDALEGR